jgi:hypothetical protein
MRIAGTLKRFIQKTPGKDKVLNTLSQDSG